MIDDVLFYYRGDFDEIEVHDKLNRLEVILMFTKYTDDREHMIKLDRSLLISGLRYVSNHKKYFVSVVYEINLYSIKDCDRLLDILELVSGYKWDYDRGIAELYFNA